MKPKLRKARAKTRTARAFIINAAEGRRNMRSAGMWALVLMMMFLMASVMAAPPGKSVEYAGGGKGKVVFDGKAHADKGLKCPDCHPKTFAMKKDAKMTMADMDQGKFCGTCHNGTKAF